MKIGIVGIGHVGGIMANQFPDAFLYDPYKDLDTKEDINQCDISFICVPTPQAPDGSCDTHIVEYVLEWLETPVIVIRSTVPVGFTDAQSKKLNKRIVFQPEYYGETINHIFADPMNRSWITLGGNVKDCEVAANAYKTIFQSNLIINIVDAKVAELAKYMENSFYANKVIFCNQFYELAQGLNVNYDQLRETWLLDPRINRDHTFVYPDKRGYGGHCLPKDLSAITYQGEQLNINVNFLKAIAKANEDFKNETSDNCT